LETIQACSDGFNFLIEKLPLGQANFGQLEPTLDTIRTVGESYVEMNYRLDKGVDQLLNTERPAPGKRFTDQAFPKIKGD
jgi:hypothetical protein